MSITTTDTVPKLDERDVADYLMHHPDFLARHNTVLETLLPPERELGDGVSDFQRFLVQRLKGQVERLREDHQALLAVGRENDVNIGRILGAALRLTEARSLEELAAIIRDEIPLLCGVDRAKLAIESADLALPEAVARLTPGLLDHWMGPADTLLQSYAAPHLELFAQDAPAMRSLAMLRIDAPTGPAGVIAFGSHDPEWFTPDQATDFIAFLAGIVSRRLAQLLP